MSLQESERLRQPYKLDAGRHSVTERTTTWYDASRDREVPVRIYRPRMRKQRFPTVVFSPGLGSSRDGYGYWGRHLASHGYVVAHLTHPGTDESLWRGVARPWPAMSRALDEPTHWLDRPYDVQHAIDQLVSGDEVSSTVDPDRIAVAGHSYGAFTALATAGLRFDLPERQGVRVADDRVSAVIAMSPQGVGVFGQNERSWDDVDRPVLSMTGTQDRGMRVKDWRERRAAFERIHGADQYLLTIKRANHYAFGDSEGIGLRPPPRDPSHHGYILMASLAFLDAYLLGDKAAKRWLAADALGAITDGVCTVEYRATDAGVARL